jgi:hypothetical protein
LGIKDLIPLFTAARWDVRGFGTGGAEAGNQSRGGVGEGGLAEHEVQLHAPSNDDTKQIGSIIDFEKLGRDSPTGIRPGPWMVLRWR